MSHAVVTRPAPPGRARRLSAGWLFAPAVVFLIIFFAYPSLKLLVLSFTEPKLSLGHYERLISTTVYLRILWNTLEISFTVTALCILFGYPLAYFLAGVSDRIRGILLIAVILPYFTSILVRSYAWMVLLGREGVVNKLLLYLGLVDRPVALIYNRTGVIVAMTHVLLPTAVLLLLSVMRGIDGRLMQVSASLGAGRTQTFLRVYLPMSLPGIGAAALLVFIFAMGNYVTPALVGGTGESMLAMVIAKQVNEVLNWPFAGALSTALTGMTVLLFFAFNSTLGLDRMWGGDALRTQSKAGHHGPSRLRERINLRILAGVDVIVALIARASGALTGGRPSRVDWSRHVLQVFAGLVMVFLILPIAIIFPISFTSSLYLSFPPEGFSLRWYQELVDNAYWLTSTWLSIRVAIVSAVLSLLVGLPAAMALVSSSFRGKNIVYAFLISPLIVPTIAIAVAVYYFFAPLHLVGTVTGLVLAHTIGGIPIVTVLLAAALKGFDHSLTFASYSLGASRLRTVARITVPIIRPAIVAAAFFAFMHSFDEVVLSTFIGGLSAETLPKKMWEGVELEIRPTLAAVSVLLIVFTALSLVVIDTLQRRKA